MREPVVAVILAGLSLLGTLVNVWLKLQIRVDLLEMKQDIMEWVGKEFVRRPQS